MLILSYIFGGGEGLKFHIYAAKSKFHAGKEIAHPAKANYFNLF